MCIRDRRGDGGFSVGARDGHQPQLFGGTAEKILAQLRVCLAAGGHLHLAGQAQRTLIAANSKIVRP